MTVVVSEHTQDTINAYGDYVLLWTSKTFSIAVDAIGRISEGHAFTSKFMQSRMIVKRLSDAVLSQRLIQEMVRVARGTLPYKDLPVEVFTDLGYKIDCTFLEWSCEAGLYLLYVVTEGHRCPVKTNGLRCTVHGKGDIDTTLLFCIPFYTLTKGDGVISVDIPNGYLSPIIELMNGAVINHNYLTRLPSVFFTYIIQEPDACEVVGNKAIIAELKKRKWLHYVK